MNNPAHKKGLLVELQETLNKLRNEANNDPNFWDDLHDLEIIDTDNLRNKKDKIGLKITKCDNEIDKKHAEKLEKYNKIINVVMQQDVDNIYKFNTILSNDCGNNLNEAIKKLNSTIRGVLIFKTYEKHNWDIKVFEEQLKLVEKLLI